MPIISRARVILRDFAHKVLDIDDTRLPENQIRLLKDHMAKHRQQMKEAASLKEMVNFLKRKHLVDSICVSEADGSTVVSSNGDDLSEAVTATALFNYISSEVPASEAVMIKANGGWFMLIQAEKRVYAVKAPASLTTVELKALARDVEKALKKKQFVLS
jgi:hypothetical protein